MLTFCTLLLRKKGILSMCLHGVKEVDLRGLFTLSPLKGSMRAEQNRNAHACCMRACTPTLAVANLEVRLLA